MDCVEEAEDPREKPCQAGIRPRTGVAVVGERTVRVVNAGALHMRQAFDNQFFQKMGLYSLLMQA